MVVCSHVAIDFAARFGRPHIEAGRASRSRYLAWKRSARPALVNSSAARRSLIPLMAGAGFDANCLTLTGYNPG